MGPKALAQHYREKIAYEMINSGLEIEGKVLRYMVEENNGSGKVEVSELFEIYQTKEEYDREMREIKNEDKKENEEEENEGVICVWCYKEIKGDIYLNKKTLHPTPMCETCYGSNVKKWWHSPKEWLATKKQILDLKIATVDTVNMRVHYEWREQDSDTFIGYTEPLTSELFGANQKKPSFAKEVMAALESLQDKEIVDWVGELEIPKETMASRMWGYTDVNVRFLSMTITKYDKIMEKLEKGGRKK